MTTCFIYHTYPLANDNVTILHPYKIPFIPRCNNYLLDYPEFAPHRSTAAISWEVLSNVDIHRVPIPPIRIFLGQKILTHASTISLIVVWAKVETPVVIRRVNHAERDGSNVPLLVEHLSPFIEGVRVAVISGGAGDSCLSHIPSAIPGHSRARDRVLRLSSLLLSLSSPSTRGALPSR